MTSAIRPHQVDMEISCVYVSSCTQLEGIASILSPLILAPTLKGEWIYHMITLINDKCSCYKGSCQVDMEISCVCLLVGD